MNISTSECSSGCESGWTTYWDQLSNCHHSYNRGIDEKGSAHDREEDDDLSMVSDASSAPPNLRDNYLSPVSEDTKRRNKQKKSKAKETRKQQHCLDDTASSPMFHFYQNNVAPPENQYNSVDDHHVPDDLSQREPKPRRNMGFFKSSTKGKSGSLQGRKRQ